MNHSSAKEKSPPPNIDSKTINDYLNFFTRDSGADMLPYVYAESSTFYNNLIKNCSDYYLCKDEVELINNNKDKIKKHLNNVTDILEIGPGSKHAVNNKTLPILKSAQNLKRYHALDYSKNYLEEACNAIQANLPELKVIPIEADLMNFGKLTLTSEGPKAILSFGCTLCNFNKSNQTHIIKEFYNLLNKKDVLILTIDNNQNKESLLKAYDNQYFYDFVMASLQHYLKIDPTFEKNLSSFEVKVELNESLNLIDAFFIVKNDLSFYFQGHGTIQLFKGQQLNGIISHKPKTDQITDLLTQNSFEVIEILDNSDKMKLFICKKL